MSLAAYAEIPTEFIKECMVDYNEPLTYLRVTHIPTGKSHYQDDTSNKMRWAQARMMGLRVVYSMYLDEP